VAFFQDLTGDAQNSAHFRYQFCDTVADIVSSAISSSSVKSIPDNFVHLYDTATGTVIEGCAFFADGLTPAPTWVLKVTGAKLAAIIEADPTLISLKATETATAYKDRFKFVQPSNSLAQAIEFTSLLVLNHRHNNADGTLAISHADLKDLVNNNSPAWSGSAWLADDHVQYLHRDGYNGGTRDLYRNGMRGHLLMLSTTSGTAYYNNTDDSNRLYFGTDAKSVYWNATNDAISVVGADIRLETAAKRLEFNDVTIYLDQTRMGKIWTALTTATAFTDLVTSSTFGAGVESSIGTAGISVTVPTGFQAYVVAHLTTSARSNTAAAMSAYHTLFKLDGVQFGDTITGVTPVNSTNTEWTSVSNTARTGLLAAGTYTLLTWGGSDTNITVFNNGQTTAVMYLIAT
jgi:hypothetical protein